jgi:hypothetical protein
VSTTCAAGAEDAVGAADLDGDADGVAGEGLGDADPEGTGIGDPITVPPPPLPWDTPVSDDAVPDDAPDPLA